MTQLNWMISGKIFLVKDIYYLHLHVFVPVVLQEVVCGLRDASGGCGWGLGAVVALGGVQQDLWRRRLLLTQTLRQPQVNIWAEEESPAQ